jgi:hypothetical protein
LRSLSRLASPGAFTAWASGVNSGAFLFTMFYLPVFHRLLCNPGFTLPLHKRPQGARRGGCNGFIQAGSMFCNFAGGGLSGLNCWELPRLACAALTILPTSTKW